MKCDICTEEFNVVSEAGAIFWGHPEKGNLCPKYHVCRKCEPVILALMNDRRLSNNG